MWKCGHVCEPQRELAATCPGILIVPLGFARFQAPQHVGDMFMLDLLLRCKSDWKFGSSVNYKGSGLLPLRAY
ncbi:hypothetical protein J6590_017033 [Homalodisca vitripennis]|nr:hypothetical protein J6590_017033 [Homalodisca vitripennis]